LPELLISASANVYGYPITWELIKKTIYDCVQQIVNERPFTENTEIIWAEENGSQPVDRYLSMRVDKNKSVGMDASIYPIDRPGTIYYIGNQEFTFSIMGYGENMINIIQMIIASFMNRIDIRNCLALGSLVFVETLNTENITELWDKRYKEVVSLDMLFRTHQQISEEPGHVDLYEWESKITSNTGDSTIINSGTGNLP